MNPSFRAAAAVVALLVGCVVSASPAAAQLSLLGADLPLGATAKLYDVNPATGAATNPRDTDIAFLLGIAFSPGGTLYGMAHRGLPNTYSLYTIDPLTGASSLVGATGLSQINEGDLAFHPVTGVLYGIADRSVGFDNRLFTINTNTGAATIVGPINPGVSNDPSGLTFLPDGRLLVLDAENDRLLTVDPATAAVLNEAALSVILGPAAGLALDRSSGVLYIADGGPSTSGTNNLYRLNPDTGALTLIGPTGLSEGLASLTFLPEPAAAAAAAGALVLIARLLPRRRRR